MPKEFAIWRLMSWMLLGRGCQLDYNGDNCLFKWPQFFKFDMPTVKISNMLHFFSHLALQIQKIEAPLENEIVNMTPPSI